MPRIPVYLLFVLFLTLVNSSYTNLVEGEVKPHSLLSRLSPKKTFRMIELIKIVDSSQECKSPKDFQNKVSTSTKVPYRVVTPAYRNDGQLSGILFKKSKNNKFYLTFIGCQCFDDVMKCSQTNKSIWKTVLYDYLLMPVTKTIRVFDEDFNHSYSADLGVQCHGGIEDMAKCMYDFALKIGKFCDPNLPVLVKITGHSLGGALAFYAALYLRKILARQLFPEKPSKLHLQVVAFAPAGLFSPSGVKKAGEIIGEENCVTFGHPDDFAMWFGSFSNFYNPGIHVKLPTIKWEYNVVPSLPTFVGHMSQRYYEFIQDWKDPGLIQFDQRRNSKALMPKWSAYLDSHRPKVEIEAPAQKKLNLRKHDPWAEIDFCADLFYGSFLCLKSLIGKSPDERIKLINDHKEQYLVRMSYRRAYIYGQDRVTDGLVWLGVFTYLRYILWPICAYILWPICTYTISLLLWIIFIILSF